MSELGHLVRRFVWSLRARRPAPAEEAWLVGLLSPAEFELYSAQNDLDRTHSVNAALAVRDLLGARATGPVVVASALHDVGKTQADLGTLGRVMATIIAKALPDGTVRAWAGGTGVRRRLGCYVGHDERGGELLREAGSHPLVVAWACEHHQPPSRWSMDRGVGQALHDSDR